MTSRNVHVTYAPMTAADRPLRERALIDNAVRDGRRVTGMESGALFAGRESFVPERGDTGFVAFADTAAGRLAVGCIWATFSPQPGTVVTSAPVMTISVSDGWRGQGIGSTLLSALRAHGTADGWPGMSCTVTGNNPAVDLLSRAGFTAEPITPPDPSTGEVTYFSRFTPPIRAMAVYCGSAVGSSDTYTKAAQAVGKALAKNNIELVYGGGNIGLMGIVADAAMEHGGTVTGIMTRALVDKEISHEHITRLEIVDTMAERKNRMEELSQAFVALPGGTGTLEEITQVMTRQQLVPGTGPIIFFNTSGYWTPFLETLKKMAAQGFIQSRFVDSYIETDDPQTMINEAQAWISPGTKWHMAR